MDLIFNWFPPLPGDFNFTSIVKCQLIGNFDIHNTELYIPESHLAQSLCIEAWGNVSGESLEHHQLGPGVADGSFHTLADPGTPGPSIVL